MSLKFLTGETHGAEKYFQPEIECASQEKMRAWQMNALKNTVRSVYDSVPYYRELMKEKNLTPDDIGGLDDLAACPSFQRMTCVKPIPMARWPGHYRTACASSPQAEPQARGWWHFIHNMIWMFGKNVALGLSLPRAAARMTLFMFATAMACSQAARA